MKAKMLQVGDRVEAFQASDQHGNIVKFPDFGSNPAVFFFLQRAMTPG